MGVSTKTGKSPLLEMALPFLVMAPSSSNIVFLIPFLELFPILQSQYQQFTSTGTSVNQFVPFPVLGSAFVPHPALGSSSYGTVICWAKYRNWTLCFNTISGTGLCQFRYGHSLGPVPDLDSMRLVPFPVLGSASSGTGIYRAPYRNWTLCGWSHFWYGTCVHSRRAKALL